MNSTMQSRPLVLSHLFEHGRAVNYDSTVTTYEGGAVRTASFHDVAIRAYKLANALQKLGIRSFDRVATFCLNHQEHLEAYLSVPSMGAVLHTLNVRIFPDQLKHIIQEAEDKVIIFDRLLAPALGQVKDALENVILIGTGPGDDSNLGKVLDYEELISHEDGFFVWPEIEENAPASMCYTSGTTGNPKGVVYSHRSTFLHTLMVTSSITLGISPRDRVLMIVPMFHVNAWGTPYACWVAGSDIIMPKQYLQAEPLAKMFNELHPTISAGVPTIWNDLFVYSQTHKVDMSSVRALVAGGSAVPKSLIASYWKTFHVPMLQGWGMTETSPLCALSRFNSSDSDEDIITNLARTGTVVPGVELRIVDENLNVLPNDGKTSGEFEVRGPWITGSYFNGLEPEKFHDGWLRTGDVGYLDAHGNMQISDRTKDVIKTGGEWISSVDLENAIMAHPAVLEASVIAIPDEKWSERPLACVVFKGDPVPYDEIASFLKDKVASWWIPEYWASLSAIPKTSVGKFDKKVLRKMCAESEVEIVKLQKVPSK